MTESHDVRVLTVSSSRDAEGGSVIELFGRTRERKSIAVVVRGFRHYFYAMDPTPSLEARIAADGSLKASHRELEHGLGKHDCLKVESEDFQALSRVRSDVSRDFKVFGGDISPEDRFVYDADMSSCIRVRGTPADLGYRTDVTIVLESFEDIDAFDPGLRYLSFDIENSIVEGGTIYCICARVEENGEFSTPEPIHGKERDIIRRFGELILSVDPDVITGYNIDNYDIPKIEERAKRLGMRDALAWGRDGGQPRFREGGGYMRERFGRLKGRLVVDALWAVRKEVRPKQESLNAVSMEILGEEKLDVDSRHIEAEWRKDREKVLEYCVQDANLALRLLLKVGTVRKGMDLATVARLPVEDVLISGTSTLVDSLLIREADRQGVAVPSNGRRLPRGEDQIAGGYVHTMKPGLYHWVVVLDFKSMYPSLMIAKNICFTTRSPDGEIVAPSGARYMSPERRRGILPQILSGLMAMRDDVKGRMRAASDPAEKAYYNGLQAAVKVVMNTFYGVFASSFYRFTDKSIGESITAFARASITGIIKQLEDDGYPVIYGDTDSVFVLSPYHDVEGARRFGEEQAARFSASEGRTLEFEKLMEPMFSHGMKKRYVGRVVWPEMQDSLLVRGYEIRRSDSFDLQSDMLTELFRLVLDEDFEGAMGMVRGTIRDVLDGKVPPGELVISKGCKGLDAYVNPDSMANVQAARKLVAMGYEFVPGMKVSWIVTDAKAVPQAVEPYVSGRPFEHRPDYDYYARRLAQMASRVTEVFGWSEKDLMTGQRQRTLLSEDYANAAPKAVEPRKEVPKDVPEPRRSRSFSLDDFMRLDDEGPRGPEAPHGFRSPSS